MPRPGNGWLRNNYGSCVRCLSYRPIGRKPTKRMRTWSRPFRAGTPRDLRSNRSPIGSTVKATQPDVKSRGTRCRWRTFSTVGHTRPSSRPASRRCLRETEAPRGRQPTVSPRHSALDRPGRRHRGVGPIIVPRRLRLASRLCLVRPRVRSSNAPDTEPFVVRYQLFADCKAADGTGETRYSKSVADSLAIAVVNQAMRSRPEDDRQADFSPAAVLTLVPLGSTIRFAVDDDGG